MTDDEWAQVWQEIRDKYYVPIKRETDPHTQPTTSFRTSRRNRTRSADPIEAKIAAREA